MRKKLKRCEVRITEDLYVRLDAYRRDAGLSSLADAMRNLLIMGLMDVGKEVKNAKQEKPKGVITSPLIEKEWLPTDGGQI